MRVPHNKSEVNQVVRGTVLVLGSLGVASGAVYGAYELTQDIQGSDARAQARIDRSIAAGASTSGQAFVATMAGTAESIRVGTDVFGIIALGAVAGGATVGALRGARIASRYLTDGVEQ